MLAFRPVNVNEAVTRVRVPLVHAVEPKDARRNEVFRFGQRIVRAERDAGFEDCSRFGRVTDFFYDAKVTERRFHAPFFSPDSKARTGNGIGTERFAIAGQREALIPNGNVDPGSRALHQSRAALQFAAVKKEYHIAVVGATGAVGVELLGVLERRNFPVAKLRALASGKSAGKKAQFRNQPIAVEELGEKSFDNVDIAFFSAGGEISRKFVPIARKAGAIVIDNSSVFRMDQDVPLVIPEINGQDVKQHRGLIANPNCTTAVALMAIYPLHRAFGVRRVFAASYQAVSGSGARAIDELKKQIEAAAQDRQSPPQVYPHPIAFNVLPHVDVFLESGYTKEEMKMQNEGRKIMHLPEFRASVTCVRVPVYRAHSVAISAEFEKKVSVEQAREVLAKAPGLELVDEPQKNRYPMPLNVAGKDNCEVGRVRLDCALENGLAFWISGDQLLKGAALNAVQIAELL